jgi:hypothetical protein
MNSKPLIFLAVGVLLISGGLLLFSSMATESKTTVGDGKHCPDCGREMPSKFQGECPFCKMTQATQGKDKAKGKGRGAPSWGASDYLVVGTVLFLILGGGFLVVRSMKGRFRWRWSNEPVFHHRCPNCKRRLRYFLRQAGKDGICPTCMGKIRLPPPPAAGAKK